MPDATIEFQIDDEYLEEFHGEWVATVGHGWRAGRRLTAGLLLVGVVLLGASLVARGPVVPLTGFACLALAAANVLVRRRAKARWIDIAREKLPVGSALRLIVEDGRVGRDGTSGETGATADLLDTPRGWMFRLTMPAAPGSDAEPQALSLYVPHRAIEPSMGRAAFRALLG